MAKRSGKQGDQGRLDPQGGPAEYDDGNLSRQRQSEGTPRPFDNETARSESRNLSGGREHYSEPEGDEGAYSEDEDEYENEFEDEAEDEADDEE